MSDIDCENIYNDSNAIALTLISLMVYIIILLFCIYFKLYYYIIAILSHNQNDLINSFLIKMLLYKFA